MDIDAVIHRLRSYFLEKGMNARQVALAADVNWRTANRLLTGKPVSIPKLRQLAEVVPAEYRQTERAA